MFIENPNIPLVIKFSSDIAGTALEVKLLNKTKIHKITSHGCVKVGHKLKAFFIMPRYGKSLE